MLSTKDYQLRYLAACENHDIDQDPDAPTPKQIQQYTFLDWQRAIAREAGIVAGRDWTGALVEHPTNCRGNCCVPETPRERAAANGTRYIVESPDAPHNSAECPGHCFRHPLLIRSAIDFRTLEDSGLFWGDIAELDYQTLISTETPAQKAARARARAEEEAAAEAGVVRYSINKKADKWTKGGQMKFRVPRPCKYATLFNERKCAGCGARVPEGQAKCSAMKGHLVCGETLAGCWAHEKSHNCIYVHPDEPQWNDACSGALCYDREHSCFHLKGDAPPVRNFRGLADRPQRQERQHQERQRPRNETSAW